MSKRRPSFFISFSRSQIAALVATAVDFSSLLFFVEVLGVWYVASTALGAFLGAVSNFSLGRHWSFVAIDGVVHHQAFKYAVVSGGSLLLNSGGVYLFTDLVGFHYTVSKLIVANRAVLTLLPTGQTSSVSTWDAKAGPTGSKIAVISPRKVFMVSSYGRPVEAF